MNNKYRKSTAKNLSKQDKQDLKCFNIFRDECNKWIDKFNLNDWEINYEYAESAEDNAICRVNVPAKIATLTLCNACDDTLIKISAMHEVLELLLFELTVLASKREWSEEAWDREVHTVIHRLQNVIYNLQKNSIEK